MKNIVISTKAAVAGVLILLVALLAGCGDGTGYPDAQTACDNVGSGTLVQSKSGKPKQVREHDEIEYQCLVSDDNPRYAVIVEQSTDDAEDQTKNSFYPDEDTLLDLATGQELPRDQADIYGDDSDWDE
jgi:hypothetical protein